MIEVDFLRVGEESKSGDAIVGRLAQPDTGEWSVFVVDAGYAETGEEVVSFIKRRYNTEIVDLAVSTHPDQDHMGGLGAVVEGLSVFNLLLHQPSSYGYRDQDDVKAKEADELAQLAVDRGTSVIAPFAGQSYLGGALTVAGPSEDYYANLLAESSSLAKRVELSVKQSLAGSVRVVKEALTRVIGEPEETLDGDNGGTTARNNTSVICNIEVDSHRVLLTGDAGVPALDRANSFLTLRGLGTSYPNLFQIPHHGSRHNMSRELIEILLGGRHPESTTFSAIASVARGADDYPRPEVSNACKRRGYKVFRTAGTNFWWNRDGAPTRSDYGPIDPLPWFEED